MPYTICVPTPVLDSLDHLQILKTAHCVRNHAGMKGYFERAMLQNNSVVHRIIKGDILFPPSGHYGPPCHIASPPTPPRSHIRWALSRVVTQRISRCIMFLCFSCYFRCCLLFFIASILVVLGIPPCRFCSSTAERLVVASCRRSHRTSDYSGT